MSMGVPYICASGAALVNIPVMLSGPNMLPVTANVSISQRSVSQGEQIYHALAHSEASAVMELPGSSCKSHSAAAICTRCRNLAHTHGLNW